MAKKTYERQDGAEILHLPTIADTPPVPFAAPVTTPSLPDVLAKNDAAISKLIRELREWVAIGQKQRGDGTLMLIVPTNGGIISPTAHVKCDWTYRM